MVGETKLGAGEFLGRPKEKGEGRARSMQSWIGVFGVGVRIEMNRHFGAVFSLGVVYT